MNKSIELNINKLAKVNWPSFNLNLFHLVALAIIATAGVMAFQKNLEAKAPEVKSIAWYAANQKAAKEQNKFCYENPEYKNTENCINSLHALEISHKGSNT